MKWEVNKAQRPVDSWHMATSAKLCALSFSALKQLSGVFVTPLPPLKGRMQMLLDNSSRNRGIDLRTRLYKNVGTDQNPPLKGVRGMILTLIIIFFININITAQDTTQSKFDLSGYVKLLGTFSHFNKDYLPPIISDAIPSSSEDYLMHNRFDLKYYPTKKLTFGVGMRNRMFYGYRVKEDATFYNTLNEDMGLMDLSYLYWDSNELLLHTIFDRLWAQWESKKWMVRLGRQRINWGVNTVWNPNDIFNQYNYLDFDYEERPGSDALRVQYFPNFKNTVELAFSPARNFSQSVGALLFKTNKWNYDFQFLGGYFKQDIVTGLGWAGNIKNAGFKGEANYYAPLTAQTQSNFTSSLSLDYMFSSGLYGQISYLYNDLGSASPGIADFTSLNTRLLSAKDIFIFKHTILVSAGFNITPLFRADLAAMFTPELNNFILFPTLSYSLSKNLDASLVVQYFISENPLENNQVEWLSSSIYGRLKYSF